MRRLIDPILDAQGESLASAAFAVPLERSHGRLDLDFAHGADGAAPVRLFQEGALKVRLVQSQGDSAQAILINTAGGLTGGDRLEIGLTAAVGAAVTVSGQACEKIYRSTGADARVQTAVRVGAGARVEWLPQPTILFDGSRLRRTLESDVAADGRLLALEALVFGRTAMGERLTRGRVADGWRLRRDGKLIYADTFRLDGDIEHSLEHSLAGRFTLAGHGAVASLIYVAPDAEARLGDLRAALDDSGLFGAASAWNGMAVARLLAADGYGLNHGLMRILTAFRAQPMPRSWTF